jgi:hypothetical protein
MFPNSINITALLEGNPSSRILDTHIRATYTNPSHCGEFRGLVQPYKPDLVFVAQSK